MARRAMANYHVWHWNGKEWDLVWHDLLLTEARELVGWRNTRAIDQQSPNRYVVAPDGQSPTLPIP